jgi:hypothetical protein
VVGRGAPVIATLALESGWLTRAMGDPAAEQSPIATLRSAAVRVEMGEELGVEGLVTCDTSASGERFEHFLADARGAMTELVPPEGVGLLERVTLRREGARVDFSARFAPGDVTKLWPASASSARP